MAPGLSIVIPVRNDVAALSSLLAGLSPMLDEFVEVIVVDGMSTDGSDAVALDHGCRVLTSEPGRGRQLNTGCRFAQGEWLWLLHADSRVPPAALDFLRQPRAPGWGRFDVAFEPAAPGQLLIAAFMNLRSRITGICTGDQGIFLHRRLAAAIHGVPEQPLMEDVELCRRLKRLGPPLSPRIRLTTSSRRWQQHGLLTTVLTMWGFRLRYWWGADPDVLAKAYYG